METKHTKGEWTIWPHNKVVSINNELIANCEHFNQDENQSNTKLIAVSLLLLKTLIEISNCKNRLDYHSDKNLLEFVIELSNNAIKKATE